MTTRTGPIPPVSETENDATFSLPGGTVTLTPWEIAAVWRRWVARGPEEPAVFLTTSQALFGAMSNTMPPGITKEIVEEILEEERCRTYP